MMIYPTLTQGYAKSIYLDGKRTMDSILADYKEPVKQYAAINYTLVQIDNALVKKYITQQEYDETIAKRP